MKRLGLLLGVLFFVSCSSDDNNVATTENQDGGFYALKIGNQWTYQYSSYIDGNIALQEPIVTTIVEEVEIIDKVAIDGITFFLFKKVVTGNDGTLPQNWFPENGETLEFYREDENNRLVNFEGEVFCVQDDVNFEYLMPEQNIAGHTLFKQLQTGNETITTSAGTFNCINFELFSENNTTGTLSVGRSPNYFAEGIGMVRDEVNFITGNKFAFKELISYSVN